MRFLIIILLTSLMLCGCMNFIRLANEDKQNDHSYCIKTNFLDTTNYLEGFKRKNGKSRFYDLEITSNNQSGTDYCFKIRSRSAVGVSDFLYIQTRAELRDSLRENELMIVKSLPNNSYDTLYYIVNHDIQIKKSHKKLYGLYYVDRIGSKKKSLKDSANSK